jgi:hypothetical protein
MTRARWLVAIAVVVLGLAAAWMLLGDRDRGAPDDASEGDASDGRAAAQGGGVAERDADLSAAATVRGEIVDEDGEPIDAGTLVLTCLDGDDVRRIPGGIVEVGEDGTFEGPGCRQKICAELDHPYLLPTEAWVLSPGSETVLHVRSAKRLFGRVVAGKDEAPVRAARVSFMAPEGDDDPLAEIPVRTRSTTTDEEGAWSVAWIEVPPCSPCVEARSGCREEPALHDAMAVMVRAEGFAPVTLPFEAEDDRGGSVDAPWVVRLPDAGDLLTGRLLDPRGRAYARAYVLARSVPRPHEQRRADVDGTSGIFEVDGLGEGAYGLRALADGVELAEAEAEAGDDVELRGTLAAGGMRLVVEVRLRGQAVADAVVDGGPFRGVRTDMKGQVSAERVLAGTIALRVRAPGRDAVRREITVAPSVAMPPVDDELDSIHEVIDLPAS